MSNVYFLVAASSALLPAAEQFYAFCGSQARAEALIRARGWVLLSEAVYGSDRYLVVAQSRAQEFRWVIGQLARLVLGEPACIYARDAAGGGVYWETPPDDRIVAVQPHLKS